MNPETARRLARAERFLAQAEEFPADKAPEAIIHLSYYAMLHAAAAVLVERTGRAPKTHGAIIGQFSNLTKADEGEGRSLSRSIPAMGGFACATIGHGLSSPLVWTGSPMVMTRRASGTVSMSCASTTVPATGSTSPEAEVR